MREKWIPAFAGMTECSGNSRRLKPAATTTLFVMMIFILPVLCNAGVGTTGGVFLEDSVGARPYGMGSAFSAIADDANSIYANPGGFHYLAYPEITTMYNKALMDTSLSYIGYIHPYENIGTFSGSFLLFDGGDIELNYLDSTSEKVKAGQDWAVTLGYGRSIGNSEIFFGGANIKLVRSTLVNKYSAIAIAMDAGLLYRTIDNKLSISLAFQNLGTKLKYKNIGDSLPFTSKFGVAYRILELEGHSVLLAGDFSLNFVKKNIGVEYWVMQMFALRLGAKLGYNPNSYTMGFGINVFSDTKLDYGYSPMIDETTHRISLSFKFGSQDKITLADKYEEKGMYARAQYIRNPDDYMYAKANTIKEKDGFIPIITSIEPKKAGPGTEIKIFGEKFGKYSNVTIGDVFAEVIKSEEKRIIAKVPNIKAGESEVVVQTDKGVSLSKTLSVMPSKPAMLEVSEITFKDENQDNILGAEETGNIIITVKNQKGAGESFGVKVKPVCTSAKNDLFFDNEINIGNIGSGEERKVEIPVKAGLDLTTGKASFKLSFTEANEYNPDPVNITFDTHKLEPPDIELAKFEIDDGMYPYNPEKLASGNNNGILEPGEQVEINAVIVNKGTGPTKNGVVKVICSDPKINISSLSQSLEFDLGSIEPEKWKEIKFAIEVKKQYKGEQNLPVKLQFSEARKMFNKDLAMNIGLGRVYAKTQDVVIKGKSFDIAIPTITSFGDDLINIPAYATTEKKNAYAVVVGIEKYRDVVSAEYAAKDAQSIRDYLISAMKFKEENIRFALNERASRNDLIRYFNVELKNNVEKDSLVFVYYSGHGAPDATTGDTYIVPYDGDPNTIKDSGYSLKQLYEVLSKLPTNKILVVIDACFSGAGGTRTLLAKGARPLVVSKDTDTGNAIAITATGAGQISGTYDEKQHGLFTYYFLKGIQGEADINKDKEIMLSELYGYLKPEVIRKARKDNRDQEPQILPSVNQIGEFEKLPLAILK